jgi:hypothetical protein
VFRLFFKNREWQPILFDEKKRKFLHSWYNLFEWLEYDVYLFYFGIQSIALKAHNESADSKIQANFC